MSKKPVTYLELPPRTKKMLRVAAARLGLTATAYVARLIEEDSKATGVAALVDRTREEVRRADK